MELRGPREPKQYSHVGEGTVVLALGSALLRAEPADNQQVTLTIPDHYYVAAVALTSKADHVRSLQQTSGGLRAPT